MHLKIFTLHSSQFILINFLIRSLFRNIEIISAMDLKSDIFNNKERIKSTKTKNSQTKMIDWI